MSTKTTREKIHELIKQNYNENTARCVVALVMPVFDALLEEARQEEREKIKKELIAKIPVALRKHSHVWTIGGIQDTIVDSIQSL